MRWLARVVIVVAALTLGVSGGLAKTPKKGETQTRVQDMVFDEAEVRAEYERPNVADTEALVRPRGSSLIKERKDFVDEILKSAEDL